MSGAGEQAPSPQEGGAGRADPVAPPAAAPPVPADAASTSPRHGARGADPGDVRASDAERQAVVDRLTRATGDGLLTLEELSVASGEVYAAVTRADLARAVAALHLPEPEAHTVAATTGAVAPPPVGTVPADTTQRRRRWTVAIMSASTRRGRWHARRREGAFSWWGSSRIDLRGAVFDGGEVEIVAIAVMGSVSVIVPEGVPVETSGLMVMGGRTARIRDVPPIAGAPRVVVRGYGLWGGVEVVSRAPKEVRRARKEEAIRQRVEERTPWADGRGSEHRARAEHHDPDSQQEQRSVEQEQAREQHRIQRDQEPEQRRGRPGDGHAPIDALGVGEPPAAAVTGEVATVMCTDIVGSTRIAVELGDQRWAAVLREHDGLVRHHVARYGGREVKTTGDGFLVTFGSARAAVACATEVHAAMDGWRANHPEAPLEVRIGVHAGEVERNGADVVGRNVTLACRLCDAAAPGEVLASSTVVSLTDSASDLDFGAGRDLSLAGFPDAVTVHPAARR